MLERGLMHSGKILSNRYWDKMDFLLNLLPENSINFKDIFHFFFLSNVSLNWSTSPVNSPFRFSSIDLLLSIPTAIAQSSGPYYLFSRLSQ